MMHKRTIFSSIVFVFLLGCGVDGEKDDSTNQDSTLSDCLVDTDCPTNSDPDFSRISNPPMVKCVQHNEGDFYCSQCSSDNDCGEGNICTFKKYCEQMSPSPIIP